MKRKVLSLILSAFILISSVFGVFEGTTFAATTSGLKASDYTSAAALEKMVQTLTGSSKYRLSGLEIIYDSSANDTISGDGSATAKALINALIKGPQYATNGNQGLTVFSLDTSFLWGGLTLLYSSFGKSNYYNDTNTNNSKYTTGRYANLTVSQNEYHQGDTSNPYMDTSGIGLNGTIFKTRRELTFIHEATHAYIWNYMVDQQVRIDRDKGPNDYRRPLTFYHEAAAILIQNIVCAEMGWANPSNPYDGSGKCFFRGDGDTTMVYKGSFTIGGNGSYGIFPTNYRDEICYPYGVSCYVGYTYNLPDNLRIYFGTY